MSLAASCSEGFYLHQAALGVNEELGRHLDRTRPPSRADRKRALLGHESPEFANLWERYGGKATRKTLHHPQVGPVPSPCR